MSFSNSAFSTDSFNQDAFAFAAPMLEAFSDAAFDKQSFDETAFAFGVGPIPPEPEPDKLTGGHFGEEYRRYLERLAKATSQKDLTAPVIEAAQAIIETIPDDVAAPEVRKIARQAARREIDFSALDAEIALIKSRIEYLYLYGALVYDYMREQDDEIALLLLMN
jgi:hypothetical protein